MFRLNKPLALVALGATIGSYGTAAQSGEGFQLDLDLRTFYMNRDFNAGVNDTVAGGQAFRLDGRSPYWGGMIGFDATLVHVAKLEGAETLNSSDVLTPEGEGYSSVEQAYLKFKPTENVKIRAGRMIMMTPLLNDITSRISSPSTQALHLSAKFDQLDLYGIYSDRASMNNSENYTPYAVNGQRYEIRSAGITYGSSDDLFLEVQHAVAEDYLRQSYLNLSYATALAGYDLLLDLRHLRGEDDGALYGSDYRSHLTGLTARIKRDQWAYTLAYQVVGGDDRYALQWGGQDNTQFFTYGAVQLLDFEENDEQSLQMRVDYDVPSLPGLHLMARHTRSWDIDYAGGDNGKRHETNLDAKYTFLSGKAKDLSVHLRVAHADGDAAVLPRINDIRVIVDYPLSLL